MLQQIADGRTDLVFDFVKTGNLPTAMDQDGIPLIRWCAYYGDVSAIKFLVSEGETLESLGRNYDLNGVCFHGHWRLCQFLIEAGADVNAALPDTGETPLHAALCKANRPAYEHIVELLLAAGASPTIRTTPGVETGCFMRDVRTRGETPLHRAAAYGSEKSIQLLLNSGSDPACKDLNGDSPLTWASWHLRPANILRLLCYDDFSIHPGNDSSYDHGDGWSQMDISLSGKPHV